MDTDPHETHLTAAHSVLRRALKELPPQDRPPPPWHLGGPRLGLTGLDVIRFSLYFSDFLFDRAPAAQHAEIARIKALVETFLVEAAKLPWLEFYRRAGEAGPDSPITQLNQQLKEASKQKKSDSAALSCARRAASGAIAYTETAPDACFASTGTAGARVIAELLADPRPMTAHAFVADLDLRVMGCEFANHYTQRIKQPVPAIDRVVFRGPNAKGDVETWIVRLPTGGFGLLGKLGAPKPKWVWVEGSREDVLAHVPEPLRADAEHRVTA